GHHETNVGITLFDCYDGVADRGLENAHIDLWRQPAVELQHPQQACVCGCRSAYHNQSAKLTRLGRLRGLDRIGSSGEQALCFVQEDAARMRQLDAALGAPEQRDPQLFLEQTHLVAERRLSDAGTAGRPGKVQLLGDSDEVTQLAKIHSSIIAKKKNGGERSP